MLTAQPFDLNSASDYVGGLSDTSKMPWLSWSLPATRCITGSKLHAQGKHTVCGQCYALAGRYRFPHVKAALEKRFIASSRPRFVEAMIVLLNEKAKRTSKPLRFRWFDAGDLPSVEFLERIVAIAEGTPTIKHWVPSKETKFVKQYLDAGGAFPSNLIVRMSVALIGAKPNKQPLGLPLSTVGRDSDQDIFQCPARYQGGRCGSCSHCWRPGNTNYSLH